MRNAAEFEAKIGSSCAGAGTLVVYGHLDGYEMEALRDTAMSGVASVTIRLFNVIEAEFEDASRVIRDKLATLTRRGVAVEVLAA